MDGNDRTNDRAVLRDPETLARLERNLRGAGMQRRTFLAMASAVAGSAALAACGGTTSPTATSAPAATATKSAAAAPSAAPTAAVAAPTTAPSVAANTVAPASAIAPAATASVASAAAPVGTTAAVAAGPESKKLFIDGTILTNEPAHNDYNGDTYAQGVYMIHAGLLRYDQDFNVLPDLAESFSNNGPVYTFKIRKGAVWSDGMPVTASQWVYSIRRSIDPRTGNGYASFWDSVRHVGSC